MSTVAAPQPRTWRLDLPYVRLPLSLNDRTHYMAAHRARTRLRDEVRHLTRALRMPRLDSILVELHWLPARKGKRDVDNTIATLKPCLDGLRDYASQSKDGRLVRPAWVGVVPDDTPEHVTWLPPIIHPPDPARHASRLWLVVAELRDGPTDPGKAQQ